MARGRPSHEAHACWRELGAELRKRRERAGLTLVELSGNLGWSHSRMSRVESGHLPVSEVNMIFYLAWCGIHHSEYGNLIHLWRQASNGLGYWMDSPGKGLGEPGRSLLYNEATANTSTWYEPQLVPGLLQTESYVRALTMERYPDWDIENAVRVRMDRQQVIQRKDPGQFSFFVHEHALRMVVGDPAIMHEQLIAVALADSLPHVTVRVLPISAGVHGLCGGPFRLLGYTRHQPLIYLDSYVGGGLFLEDKSYVDKYRRAIPALEDVALTERESREFLSELADDHDRVSASV